MQRFWIIALLFLLLNSFSTENEERIAWQEGQKLTWADFKATPDTSVPYAAITASGLYYEYSGKIKGGEVSYDSKVVCYFYPYESWYKKELASENLLAHEQLHFDISELHARKLRKEIEIFNFTKDIKQEMESLYQKVNASMKTMQSQYDSEANYSMDKEQQKTWQEKVKKELQRFRDYK